MIRVSFLRIRMLKAVSVPEIRQNLGQYRLITYQNQVPPRLSGVSQQGEGKSARYRLCLHILPSPKAESTRR